MDIEAFILDALENIGQFDFNFAIKVLIIAIGVIWVFTTYWVWKDTESRIESMAVRLVITLLVLPFNFIALIAYLLSRPRETFESSYWSDLEKRYLQYETSDMGDCENCGYDLRPGFIYCPVCAHPVKVKCHNCGELIDRYWNFCPYCSAQQREFVQQKREVIEQEREDAVPDLEVTGPKYEREPEPVYDAVEEEEPEVTNEPQPEFGIDDIEKKPEVRRIRPEQQVIAVGRPARIDTNIETAKKEISIPTELGKYVITSVSAFGKKINDFFVGVAKGVKNVAEVEINDGSEAELERDTIDDLSDKVEEREGEIAREVRESISYEDESEDVSSNEQDTDEEDRNEQNTNNEPTEEKDPEGQISEDEGQNNYVSQSKKKKNRKRRNRKNKKNKRNR